jgi:DNA-binding response OmpR family regulator
MTKGQLLIVDDEKGIRDLIGQGLASHDYAVQTAADTDQAIALIADTRFDAALIDLNLPGSMNGIGLIGEIRKRSENTLVVVLTGYGTMDSAIAALRLGAFDYLAKPANLSQILEVVERGLARQHEDQRRELLISQLTQVMDDLKGRKEVSGTPVTNRFLQTATLMIDSQKHIAVCDGKPLALTPTEFEVLDYLAHNSDHVVTASEMVKAIYRYEIPETEARDIIRVHIQRLREKLEDSTEKPRYVQTVRGKGYRFIG